MTLRNTWLAALLLLVTALPWSVSYAATYDVLKLAAVPSDKASQSLIYSIRKYGDRYFATGIQGHILYSDDGGDSWTQADVPVRSSITDIFFVNDELGWAVGHEGTILHSSDGGKTWVLQYDGLRYGQEGLAYYQKLAESDPENELYPYMVEEMEFAIGQGADKPFFRVFFHNDSWGHAVGAYGMIMATFDGGKNWEHRLHTVENDSFYHIFDFAPLPEENTFLLSGEAGLFLAGDVRQLPGKATRLNSVPWEGSFFTALNTADGAIVTGGLRGRMFRTDDIGETWVVVEKPVTSSIVDSTRLADDTLIFVGVAGEILASTDNGLSFSRLPISSGTLIYSVAEGPDGTLLVAGPRGIDKLKLPQ